MMKPILIAISDNWHEAFAEYLTQWYIQLIVPSTYDDAVNHAKSTPLAGAVVVSDWLLTPTGEKTTLHHALYPQTPTIVLMRPSRIHYEQLFDDLYYLPHHEYAHIPVDREELYFRMKHIGMIPST